MNGADVDAPATPVGSTADFSESWRVLTWLWSLICACIHQAARMFVSSLCARLGQCRKSVCDPVQHAHCNIFCIQQALPCTGAVDGPKNFWSTACGCPKENDTILTKHDEVTRIGYTKCCNSCTPVLSVNESVTAGLRGQITPDPRNGANMCPLKPL